MAWRVAKSLDTMRTQANELFPARNKSSDGTIGDAAHQSSNSDHNPWVQDSGQGVVTALDLTHDPGQGMDTWSIAEYLRTQKDPRIKYVISNKRIFSSTSSPWQWRKYTGSNPHSAHMHVSVNSSKSHYDNTAAWKFVPEEWRPTLRRGNKGFYVRLLQGQLKIPEDDDFGAGTEAAVKNFQAANGLTVDGICGPLTWNELNVGGNVPVAPPVAPVEPEQPPPPDPSLPGNRPILRRGSKGEEVKTVQGLLLLSKDGDFGALTEAAVRGFQRGAGLEPNGVVGAAVWEELDGLEQTPILKYQANIVATVFGGTSDPNKSAYEDRWITDQEMGVALPYRFSGDRPQVVVQNAMNGKRVTCEIVDVGPWNTNDPYWETETRPQAESGTDTSGRKTNHAGIDLTPAAASTIGLSGKGMVHWAFAEDMPDVA